ncbi:MAG: ATP-binding protein, partial [Bacteroidetes bacterium]
MYINRNIEGLIKKYLSQKEIIAVVGPRQSGKTTMIKNLLSGLKRVNIITLDDVEILNMFQNDIKSFISLYVKDFEYVFIDEIQYAQESGRQLKFIHDTTDAKLIISGSSTAEISIQSLKYLVGRIFVFELYPFNFEEYLSAKDPALLPVFKEKNFGEEIENRLGNYIRDFVIYGGYPRVVLSENEEEKKLVLKNIYNTLILREVKDLFGISMSDKLVKLIKALAWQIGNLINYTELCDLTGFKFPELKASIDILEKTYIVDRCYPFSGNKRTELVKNPKIFFTDTGLRNVIINNFIIEREGYGALYENLIYSEFLKKGKKLNYWRTKSGAEVDFIDGK